MLAPQLLLKKELLTHILRALQPKNRLRAQGLQIEHAQAAVLHRDGTLRGQSG